MQYRKLSELKKLDNNPRTIKQEDMDKLVESIKDNPDYFEARPLILSNRTGELVILGGNQRYEASKVLKLEKVPTHLIENLTEEREREIIIRDNVANGEWDWDLLANEWDDDLLEDWGLELPESMREDEEIVEDEAPEVSSEPPESQSGSIYQLGKRRVMCGDSTDKASVELLMNGAKADMVFTDPPYGMDLDADYTSLSWGDRKGKKYDDVIGDRDDFTPELITTIFDNFGYCKEMFLWGADYYFELIPEFKKGHYIVWDKTLESNGDAGANSEYELLWTKQRHKRTVLHFNWFRFFGLGKQDMKTREHPTQKPLQVCEPIIKQYSKDNDVIADTFLGSGSTLIACEQTDRICYGMELDPKYVDVIRKRWAKFVHGEEALENDRWIELTPEVQNV